MLTILIFIIVLGVLVFVHELGHFLVAKWNGIKSDEFGFGFPPRLVGVVRNETTGRYEMVWGNREVKSKNTVYSLNWIPLGGFVKIKGEDALFSKDPDSFANKSAWIRVKVMGAGVVMNILLAWLLLTIVLMIGIPQAIDPSEGVRYPDTHVRVNSVLPDSPAAEMGLKMGDEIVKLNGREVTGQTPIGEIIKANAGKTVTIEVDRLGEKETLSGTPRTEYSPTEGSLGFSYVTTALVSYPWYEAIIQGFTMTWKITWAILEAFGKMIAYLFGGEKVALDVTGPVGIVYLTKQMNDLGLAYLLQFAALLSINLAIINILPIPALDGGRILFVLIEKLKGRPVSQKTEGMIHQIGFILLLLLMFFITIRDFVQFRLLEKIGNFF